MGAFLLAPLFLATLLFPRYIRQSHRLKHQPIKHV